MAKSKKATGNSEEDKKYPLPPEYEAKDDIYAHEKKVPVKGEGSGNTDLDVPGAELDDAEEEPVMKMKKTIITAWVEMSTMTLKMTRRELLIA